jgi:hypothetical protein
MMKLRCFVAVLIGGMGLSALPPLSATTLNPPSRQRPTVAILKARENRGALYWHGNLISGDIALLADSTSGQLLLAVTSAGGRQQLLGSPRTREAITPSNQAQAAGASGAPGSADGLQQAQQRIDFKNGLHRIFTRMHAKGAPMQRIADSLVARAHQDSALVERVTLDSLGMQVTFRGIPGAEHLLLSPTGEPNPPTAASIARPERSWKAEYITQELREGVTVFVGPSQAIGLLPRGQLAALQAQLDTLRMGRVPRYRIIPDAEMVQELLAPVPISELER